MRCLSTLSMLASFGALACGPASTFEKNASELMKGCGLESLSACDVHTRRCQAAVFQAVACMTEQDVAGSLPEVRFLPAEEVVAALAAPTDAPEAEELRRAAFEALGLATESEPDPSSDPVLYTPAVYVHATGQILMVEDGSELSDAQAIRYLAHEMVHALQDQRRSLAEQFSEAAFSLDETLALSAALEGEATFYEWFVQRAIENDELAYETLQSQLQSELALTDHMIQRSEEPVPTAQAFFPYSYGALWAKQRWDISGAQGLMSLQLEELRSTRWVVLDTGDGVPDEAPLPLEAPPQGYKLAAQDTLGGFITAHLVLAREANTEEDLSQRVRSVVSDYSADRLAIYVSAESTAWRIDWRVRWSTDEAATRLATSLTARFEGRSEVVSTASGRDTTLTLFTEL